MACQHEDFESRVDIGRITDEEGGDVVTFVADVKVRCVVCGESFGFRGMPPGMSWGGPTRSPNACEARLPLLTPTEMELAGPLPGLAPDPPLPPMPGFTITVK